MRYEMVTLEHEGFAHPLEVVGTLERAERDIGMPARFELEFVSIGNQQITHLLSERLLNELADDAFEILQEQGR